MILDYIGKTFLVLGILFFIAALYHLYKNDVLETISGVKEFEQAQEIYNQKLDESRKVFDDLNKKNINRGGDTGEVKILSELSIIPAKSDASRELEDLEALYKQAEKRMQEEDALCSEKTVYLDEEEQITYLDDEKTSFLEDEFVDKDKTSFLEEDDEKTSFLEVEDEKTEFLSDNEEKTTFLNMDDEKTDFLSNNEEKTTFLE